MLRHSCGSMPKHNRYFLLGYIVSERNGSPECMPGDMSGDIFFNPAEICYFFEIAVHFLIAGNWETISFFDTDRIIFILF